MEKKKILRIISRLNIGGPAIHVILLSEALNRDGYKDTLVCGSVSDCEGDMKYFADDRNVIPLVIPELKRDISFKDDLTAFYKLYTIMRKERPHIVHTHAAKAGALGRVAAILSGVPIKIHTFHGHIFDGYFSPVKAKIFLLIERFLALFTDKVITVSESVKEEIVNKLKVTKDSKCAVVMLGFELDRFLDSEKARGAFRKELSVPDGVILIGIVGRIVPIKNHRMFLDAAKILLDKSTGKKIMFVIVGDGELAGYLKDYSKNLGIDKSVVFTGWRKDLPHIYADLDIVTLTSLNEGTPVSIIEAMASARPVVATAVGGVKDLIVSGECGFLVKREDAQDLADKIELLIKDSDKRTRFGYRARELVRNKYSKERLVGDIKNLYEECLRKKYKVKEAH